MTLKNNLYKKNNYSTIVIILTIVG